MNQLQRDRMGNVPAAAARERCLSPHSDDKRDPQNGGKAMALVPRRRSSIQREQHVARGRCIGGKAFRACRQLRRLLSRRATTSTYTEMLLPTYRQIVNLAKVWPRTIGRFLQNNAHATCENIRGGRGGNCVVVATHRVRCGGNNSAAMNVARGNLAGSNGNLVNIFIAGVWSGLPAPSPPTPPPSCPPAFSCPCSGWKLCSSTNAFFQTSICVTFLGRSSGRAALAVRLPFTDCGIQ